METSIGGGCCCTLGLELDVSPLIVVVLTEDVVLSTLQMTCRMLGPSSPASLRGSMFKVWHAERRPGEEAPSSCKSFKPSKAFCKSKCAWSRFENNCTPIAVSHLQALSVKRRSGNATSVVQQSLSVLAIVARGVEFFNQASICTGT